MTLITQTLLALFVFIFQNNASAQDMLAGFAPSFSSTQTDSLSSAGYSNDHDLTDSKTDTSYSYYSAGDDFRQ
jgi:hypothetical protein